MKRTLGAILRMLFPSCAELHPRRTSQLAVDPAYQQSFEKWKGDLVEDLKQEWLPLAGLFWLKPGENSFGTDAEKCHRLSQRARPRWIVHPARPGRDRQVCSGC